MPTEIVCLDSRNFANASELRISTERIFEPILMIVSPEELSDVLDWIQEEDDVCCHTDCPELIEHRRLCLQSRMAGLLDPLTKTYTRQRFNLCMESELQSVSRNHPVSLVLVDLDHFKRLNDEHGHHFGDEVLRNVGQVLKEYTDRSASVGRIGGEEFGIVCNRDSQAAIMLAETLRHKIGRLSFGDGLSISASFGVVTATSPIEYSELLSRASQSLYAAKAKGRNCYVAYCDLQECSRVTGNQVDVIGLENQAKVLAERVANVITMRSRQILKSAREEADVDGLTGCYTRRYLDRRLESEFENRNHQPLSVAFLDLDYFGQVNKEFGWPTGDKLLVEVCEAIRNEIRESDWIGRYGGEEFCIVMPATKLTDATVILQRIRKSIESTSFQSIDQRPVPMTISVGAAETLAGQDCYSELLDWASERALIAKRNGRNQICVAS